jgi:hypothetical protein
MPQLGGAGDTWYTCIALLCNSHMHLRLVSAVVWRVHTSHRHPPCSADSAVSHCRCTSFTTPTSLRLRSSCSFGGMGCAKDTGSTATRVEVLWGLGLWTPWPWAAPPSWLISGFPLLVSVAGGQYSLLLAVMGLSARMPPVSGFWLRPANPLPAPATATHSGGAVGVPAAHTPTQVQRPQPPAVPPCVLPSAPPPRSCATHCSCSCCASVLSSVVVGCRRCSSSVSPPTPLLHLPLAVH